MKLKYQFEHREVLGEHLFLVKSEYAKFFSEPLKTNEVGAVIVEALNEEISEADLVKLITDKYDIDESTALSDLREVLDSLKELRLLN